MPDEIVNRVANNTNLISFDLEDFYPSGDRILIDIKDWLFEGLIVREKEFRKHVSDHNWSLYQDKYIAFNCSTDAIIPGWAYMLLTSTAAPYAKKISIGSLDDLETVLYTNIINNLDVSTYQNKLIIIKGCTNKPVPQSAYIALVQKLQPVAKSIMYGEACSSVPIYKRK